VKGIVSTAVRGDEALNLCAILGIAASFEKCGRRVFYCADEPQAYVDSCNAMFPTPGGEELACVPED